MGDRDADGALGLDHLNRGYAHAAAGRGDDDKVPFATWPSQMSAPYAVRYCIQMDAACQGVGLLV